MPLWLEITAGVLGGIALFYVCVIILWAVIVAKIVNKLP